MSLKRLQEIIEEGGSDGRDVKLVLTITPSTQELSLVVGHDSFIPEVAIQTSNDSFHTSLDDLANGMIDDLAARCITVSVKVPPPKGVRKPAARR